MLGKLLKEAHLIGGNTYRLHFKRKHVTRYPEKELATVSVQLRWLKSDLSRLVCCLQSTTGGKQRPTFEDAALPAALLEIIPKEKGRRFCAVCPSLTPLDSPVHDSAQNL